ncbi:MAG: S-layer homology domain-containing protein [Oscillospiraceae bacterium]|nr:S-layer homology domain-containing protein [Oscillospiraceae bacterium]
MKKIVSFIIAAVMMLSLAVIPAGAASAAPAKSEMLGVLSTLGVMNGDEKGELNLSAGVTRAQFAKMAVTASAYADVAGSNTGISPFGDVSAKHWAASYITCARDLGWLYGYIDGTFRPDEGVSLAEAATVCLRMLGYGDSYFTGSWPTGQMNMYRSLGLDRCITAGENTKLTREQCAWLIYNTLGAKTTASTAYAQTLGYALDASGNINYLTLLSAKMEGPVIAGTDWQSQIGFAPRTVYKNDVSSTAAAVSIYDALYYIENSCTLWAYSTRHTGTLDSVLPARSNPTSIVVSGVTYPIGSSQAAVAVSSMGDFRIGDTITVIMGRDGVVAGVMDAKSLDSTLYGVVVGSGTGTYSSGSGSFHSAKYVEILGVDGQSYKFTTPSGYLNGTVVKVSVSNGSVNISQATSSAVSGKVSATTIGSKKFAPDVQILDYSNGQGIVISPSRLEGATLTSGDVKLCVYDGDGNIDALILDNVTGDMSTYGLLTSAAQVGAGLNAVSGFDIIISGQAMTLAMNGSIAASTGDAVRIDMTTGGTAPSVSSVQSLKKAQLSQLSSASGTTVVGDKIRLAGSVQVYENKAGGYYYTSLSNVSTQTHTLYGWYDSRPAGGIRVIVAVPR